MVIHTPRRAISLRLDDRTAQELSELVEHYIRHQDDALGLMNVTQSTVARAAIHHLYETQLGSSGPS